MNRSTILLALVLIVCSCRNTQSVTSVEDYFEAPPGTIKVSDNLFLDQTEICNFYYLEYLFWMQKTYGKASEEYQSALPDTTVWSDLHISCAHLDTSYLRHPAYRYYPLVGISFEQAERYSNWRSDRVMEKYLVASGRIPNNPYPPLDSIFTIEKYFKGEYYGISPNMEMAYPKYSLPTAEEYAIAASFADSNSAENISPAVEKRCGDFHLIDQYCFEKIQGRTEIRPYGPDPSAEVICFFTKRPLITHLKGNVREMTSMEGTYYGGSFVDSCAAGPISFRQDSVMINSYTGFRNSCRFLKWGEQ